MKTHIFAFLLATAMATMVHAANPVCSIRLYPNGVMDSNGYNPSDEYVKDGAKFYQIADPRMDIYLPSDNQLARGIILSMPGGGYRYVSTGNEGIKVADYFTVRGYAVAVLKYRLPNGHENIPLEDAMQAMRILRDSARVWAQPGASVGVMGFSAGGHLAASLLTLYTDAITRPDYGVLVYPVISMDANLTHKGSCLQLLGENPTEEQRNYWSCEKNVTSSTPPCIIVACQDDPTVQVANSIRFYEALTENRVPSSLLIVPVGKHGWGYSRQFPDRELIEQAVLTFIINH